MQLSREVIVPIGKDGRRHNHIVSHNAANRMPPGIDLGLYFLDDNAVAAVRRLHRAYPSTAGLAMAASGAAKAFVAWMQEMDTGIALAAGEDRSHMQARSPSKESMTYSARTMSTSAGIIYGLCSGTSEIRIFSPDRELFKESGPGKPGPDSRSRFPYSSEP
jgi:hypothetical protein